MKNVTVVCPPPLPPCLENPQSWEPKVWGTHGLGNPRSWEPTVWGTHGLVVSNVTPEDFLKVKTFLRNFFFFFFAKTITRMPPRKAQAALIKEDVFLSMLHMSSFVNAFEEFP